MFASMLPPVAAASASCRQAPLGTDCCCCKRCGMGGCDLKVMTCNCCLHTRCAPISDRQPLSFCPVCLKPATSLQLMPMNFEEIDKAQQQQATKDETDARKRGKKRLNAATLQPTTKADDAESSELRTGRWTPEETAYCDMLIVLFEKGKLPIPEGIKLNDFLSGMLRSKQSRLTKKMKNAKLSSRQYRRTDGYIQDASDAMLFSQYETSFFASIKCDTERAEIRFHMQKEWRELYSKYCVGIQQKIDAVSWLSSVEEMDRRASLQKDAARMTRRKLLMGYALSHDQLNQPDGVFIDPNVSFLDQKPSVSSHATKEGSDNGAGSAKIAKRLKQSKPLRPLSHYSSPFVGKVMQYMERYNVPFEHVDAWVPSHVAAMDATSSAAGVVNGSNCRLCFAGCATAETRIPPDGGAPIPLTREEEFDLMSFGIYSNKFSFDVGCGLPGRVYNLGCASWERGVHKAPATSFERCGGANQWGIQTVLGIPIASPNVGRIVVLLYSRYDREQDNDLVNRMTEEFTKMMPSPQWKLVVDLGGPQLLHNNTLENSRKQLLLSLIEAHTPPDQRSPLAEFLPGFASIRLLLIEHNLNDRENELLKSAVACFQSYKASGRDDKDATWMTARDFMILSRNHMGQSSYYEAGATDYSSNNANTAYGNTNNNNKSSTNLHEYQSRANNNNNSSNNLQEYPNRTNNNNNTKSSNNLQEYPSRGPDASVYSGNGSSGMQSSVCSGNGSSAMSSTYSGNGIGSSGMQSLQRLVGQTAASSIQKQVQPVGGAPSLPSAQQLQQHLLAPLHNEKDAFQNFNMSPILQPIQAPNHLEQLSNFGVYGLSQSQMQALLQNDGSLNFPGM